MGGIFSVSLSCDDTISRSCDALQRAAYVRRIKENIQHLNASLEELKCLRNDVKRKVAVAEQQPRTQQLEQVRNWISEVDSLEAQVREAVGISSQQICKLCCGGWCSKNYVSSYKYGRKVAKLLVEVANLKSKGDFSEVAERLPEPLMNERPLEPTVGLETMLDKVWSHVEDVDVGVIGLYGMGGVGKTTLLTQIHNKFQQTDFDFAMWIVVSKDLRVEAIQNIIAEKIGLKNEHNKWELKNPDAKTVEISSRLSRKKFVLFLDDLWERIDITKIGVPYPDQRNKSKVILTTRSEAVCSAMSAQQKIFVECLPWDKAWCLFQDKLGREALLLHADIPKLAEDVAKECGGLPLALTTVARVMSCKKTPEEWSHAIKVLKKSCAEFSGMGDQVFPLLKFSYDNFPNEKVKACFLYCALFPEDSRIFKEHLVCYWMCENMLDEHTHLEEARNETYHIIGTLLTACMLQEADKRHVKMHDVVRDMALWLACDPNKAKGFLVRTGADLIEAPKSEEWKNSERVSLMANHIKELVEAPNSPYLLTLFLSNNNLQNIASSFFDSMSNLQVLDMSSNKDLTQLPDGVSILGSLKYLNVSYTGLTELPVGVSRLVLLKHLDVSHTGLTELRIELKCLKKLEYLNFEYTQSSLPSTILSSFQKLKVLRMFRSGHMAPSRSFDDEKAMIKELHGLKHLEDLTLDITSTSCFEDFINCGMLTCCTRGLHLACSDNASNTLDISSADLKRLEQLYVGSNRTMEEVVLDIDWAGGQARHNLRNSITRIQGCFQGLQMISIYHCDSIKDLTQLCFAPNLITVYVDRCNAMESIIDKEKLGGDENVAKDFNLFAKLEELVTFNLPLLKSIHETALPFPCLRSFHVDTCPNLKKLPFDSSSCRGGNDLIVIGEQKWWDALQWEDPVAHDVFQSCHNNWM